MLEQERPDHGSEADWEANTHKTPQLARNCLGSVNRKDLKNLPTAVGRILKSDNNLHGLVSTGSFGQANLAYG